MLVLGVVLVLRGVFAVDLNPLALTGSVAAIPGRIDLIGLVRLMVVAGQVAVTWRFVCIELIDAYIYHLVAARFVIFRIKGIASEEYSGLAVVFGWRMLRLLLLLLFLLVQKLLCIRARVWRYLRCPDFFTRVVDAEDAARRFLGQVLIVVIII